MPLREQMSEEKFNKYLVRFELQADYYAGVWAHHAQGENLLEEGDLEEALTAANAVGDDTLQEKGQGYVVPESFTHGTSAQRERWFQKVLITERLKAEIHSRQKSITDKKTCVLLMRNTGFRYLKTIL